jgi:DHA1 family tetracycline resistance protein-like MFS transporter
MKRLGVLWLVVFISLAGFGITTIPFPFVAESLGASDFWKTFGGSGVFSLFQLVATPIWGRFSDAYGRKPILILSTAGTILSFVWLAYASTLESLLVARAFGGIMSGNLAAAFAYTTDVTDPKDRAKGLGIVASAFGVGFAVGPVIGGFLGTIGGVPSMHWPALASAGLSALAFVGTVFFLPESLPAELRKPIGRKAAKSAETAAATDASGEAIAPAPRRSPLEALRSRPVLLGLVSASLFIAIAGGVMQSVFQFWGRDLFNYTLRDIGVHFMVFALLSARVVCDGPERSDGLDGYRHLRAGKRPISAGDHESRVLRIGCAFARHGHGIVQRVEQCWSHRRSGALGSDLLQAWAGRTVCDVCSSGRARCVVPESREGEARKLIHRGRVS